jgi:hypothetical protein
LVGFEQFVVFDAILLLQIGVDTDGVEQFVFQQIRQLFGAIHFIHKNDGLVEGQSVQ